MERGRNAPRYSGDRAAVPKTLRAETEEELGQSRSSVVTTNSTVPTIIGGFFVVPHGLCKEV